MDNDISEWASGETDGEAPTFKTAKDISAEVISYIHSLRHIITFIQLATIAPPFTLGAMYAHTQVGTIASIHELKNLGTDDLAELSIALVGCSFGTEHDPLKLQLAVVTDFVDGYLRGRGAMYYTT